ncbi:CHAT domain-containing tetratricopeptide repeat protein [Leptolyngbya sp. GGD]|uniref:CHAT domain-containing tetratricopeptide repeat protein n=1 Tax=Leptolyngbya sp. GGD TaxID=2997907 RepID=UPI00227A5D67|nr:tetratricopeptide repeat protein [Leptolyngbya sp. GGD]MCY6493851.1 tetratricopeptide repeat protein [Leptolyngbya sp. GGD]
MSDRVFNPLPAIAQTTVAQSNAEQFLQQGKKQYETGEYEAALKLLQQALTLSQQNRDRRIEAETWLAIGATYAESTTNNKAGEDALQQALKIAKEAKDIQLEGWILMTFGRLYLNNNQDAKAQEFANQSLEIARKIQDKSLEARSLFIISGVYQYAENGTSKAIELTQQALNLAQQISDKRLEGRVIGRIGSILQGQDKYLDAIAAYQKALPLSQAVNDRRNIVLMLVNMGESYNSLKQYNKAIQVLEPAIPLAEFLPIQFFKFQVPFQLGLAYADTTPTQPEKSFQVFQVALKVAQQNGYLLDQYRAWFNIGAYYSRKQDYQNALKAREAALEAAKKLNNPKVIAEAYHRIGSAASLLKDYKVAKGYFEQAIELYRKERDPKNEADTLISLGDAQYLNQPQEALQSYQQALNILQTLNEPSSKGDALFKIAGAYMALDKTDLAIDYMQQSLAVRRTLTDRSSVLNTLLLLTMQYSSKAFNLHTKGFVSQAKAEVPNIQKYAQESLTLAQELKQQDAEAKALIELGKSYHILDDYSKATELLKQSEKLAYKIKAIDTEKSALNVLANIYIRQGNFREKLRVDLRSAEIARVQNDELSLAFALGAVAGSYNSLGDYSRSLETFQEALKVVRSINIEQLPSNQRSHAQQAELMTLGGIVDSYTFLGKLEEALQTAQERVRIAQTFKKPELEAQSLSSLASFYQNSGNDFLKAIEIAEKALSIAQQIKEPKLEAEAWKNISQSHTKLGNFTPALEAAEKMLQIAKRLGDPVVEHNALTEFRNIYQAQGNFQKAIDAAKQLLAVVQQRNLQMHEATALFQLGESYLSAGDIQGGFDTAQRMLVLSRKEASPHYEVFGQTLLGRAYKLQGEYGKSVEALQIVLKLAPKNKVFLLEAVAVNELAIVYEALGEYQKIIDEIEPRLPQVRTLRSPTIESPLLAVLGYAYASVGDTQKGKASVEQGLAIAQKLKNPYLESLALSRLSYVYINRNDYSKALQLAQQSLQIAQTLKSPPLAVDAQYHLGEIYNVLGDYKKSREYYEQVLATFKQLNNRRGEGVALLILAQNAFNQGNPSTTIDQAQQAFSIFQAIKEPRLATFAQRVLATGYGELGNDAKAMEVAQASLTFARTTKNRLWEKQSLALIGSIHRKFGRHQQAIDAYEQALAIPSDNQITGANAFIYAGLARTRNALKQPTVAITHYKQAIENIQAVRRAIVGLPPELQRTFLDATVDLDRRKVSDIYRELAALLNDQGEIGEAVKVMELLKDQELKETKTASPTQPAKVTLSDVQEKIRQQHGTLIALGQKIDECQNKAGNSPQQCSELIRQRQVIVERYATENREIDKQINDRRAKDRDFLDPGDPYQRQAIELTEQQPDGVLIYPLVLNDRIQILVASRGKIVQKFETKVEQTKLNQTVEKFQELLRDKNSDLKEVQATGQKLYTWLIQPLEQELKAGKIKHLVFALDRSTRYIPMAALFDGKQYLIENYTIATVLSAEKTDLSDKGKLPNDRDSIRVLGMGLSQKVPNWDSLPNVPQELDAIVRQTKQEKGIFMGNKFLDPAFTFETLRDNLHGHHILHLATHGKFVPDQPAESFILLGNGEKLKISQFGTLPDLFDVNLVTLSACETALGQTRNGDGLEIASVSSAILARSKSVMASLWRVGDNSTRLLMEGFYSQLAQKQSLTKAESLRNAQLALLRNQIKSSPDKTRSLPEADWVEGKPGARSRTDTPAPGTTHPYHWAAFILIGNSL